MANLVIKPASGSGNKVVFQNQAGTVDAITVEDSGSTTLAGTTNALGTVASGNISNTAIVFPAGHIIQVVQKTDTDFATSDVSAYSNALFDNLNISITPHRSSSKILVTVNLSLCHQNNDTGHARLVRDPTGTPVALAIGASSGTNVRATFSMRNASNMSMHHQSMNYLDSPTIPSTPVAIWYGVQGFTSGSQYGVFGYNMPESTSTSDPNFGRSMSVLTLMEVAQ